MDGLSINSFFDNEGVDVSFKINFNFFLPPPPTFWMF